MQGCGDWRVQAGGLFLCQSFGNCNCWIIGKSGESLFSLIAVFCLTVFKWISSGGIAVSISRAYIGDVQNTALMSVSTLFCITMSSLICDAMPEVQTGAA
jgi:hypothetical protein